MTLTMVSPLTLTHSQATRVGPARPRIPVPNVGGDPSVLIRRGESRIRTVVGPDLEG